MLFIIIHNPITKIWNLIRDIIELEILDLEMKKNFEIDIRDPRSRDWYSRFKISRTLFEISSLEIILIISRLEISRFFSHLEINLEIAICISRCIFHLGQKKSTIRDLILISRLEISRFFYHLEIKLEKPFSRSLISRS